MSRGYLEVYNKTKECPECHQQKKIWKIFEVCLSCLAKRKSMEAFDKSEMDKVYAQPFLNKGDVKDEDLSELARLQLSQDSKSDYWRIYLEQLGNNHGESK